MTVTDVPHSPSSGDQVDERARQLAAVAQLLADSIRPCAMATVTLVERASTGTAASTDPIAEELDRAQFDEDSGPGLTALRTQTVVALDRIVPGPGRYERFRAVAADLGVSAMLALPLDLDGSARGALNCYSVDGVFDEEDQHVAEAIARFASTLIE